MRIVEWDSTLIEIKKLVAGNPYRLSLETIGGARITGTPWVVTPSYAVVRMTLKNGQDAFVAISAIEAVILEEILDKPLDQPTYEVLSMVD